MTDKREILEDVKSLLEYAKTLGMTEVTAAPPEGQKNPRDAGTNGRTDEIVFIHSSEPAKRAVVPQKVKTRSAAQKAEELESLRKEIGDCKGCKLCKGRKNIVFGVGNPDADIMFIGEAPGADEDEQGEPFVGRAGQLLTKIIEAMGYKRGDVYIANICKCRPPNNRAPLPDEVAACIPYLIRQVEIIGPKCIVCLGSVATQNLLGTEEKISKLRGRFTEWRGTPVMPTYHPAFLLRNMNMKKPVWEDMQKVMEFLGKKKP